MGDPVIPLPRRSGARPDARRVGLREMGASGVSSGPDLDVLIALDHRLAAIEALLRSMHPDEGGMEGEAGG